MSSKATINPTDSERLARDFERIATLKAQIAKHKARGNDAKVASVQSELDTRLARVKAAADAL